MARENPVSDEIYRRHIRLYRYINDAWIFTQIARPLLKEKRDELRASKSKMKKPYAVPKKDYKVFSKRRDEDVAQIFHAQFDRGVFETHIVNIVSRTEAFIQECMTIAIVNFPEKLSVISEKAGIPLDMFLAHEQRDELLAHYVASRCQGLMFGSPKDYMAKFCKILSIDLKENTIEKYIEIKASRDIIVHNSGAINSLYRDKAGAAARGNIGDELVIDLAYFKHVLVTVKLLSGEIQQKTETVYG